MLISSCTVTTIAFHEGDKKKKQPKKRSSNSNSSSRSGVLKLALFVARKQSKATPPKSGGDEKGFWKTMICSMRHLHQLEHGSRDKPPTVVRVLPPAHPIKDEADSFEDPCSLMTSSSPERPLADGRRSSASAEDLWALGNSEGSSSEEEDEPNEIDLRAEEFIQKFYEQIRLQTLESAFWLYG